MKTKHGSTEVITNVDSLLKLFRAFRNQNDVAFQKVAEAIIADVLAGNDHATAKELKAALGTGSRPRTAGRLQQLPRDRRTGDHLITIYHEPASTDHLLLDNESQDRIDRIIDERRNTTKLARHGLTPKAKLLFWGPPGCGKTLTAHHLANQFGIKVGVVRLDALISSFLGDTSSHLQQAFDAAINTPMVLLFDEIDSIGKSRNDRNDVGELKRVVNSLLQAMDTFVAKDSILIGASNHQYLLDPAIWRRFDDIIMFPKPSPKLRGQFVEHHLNGVSFQGSIGTLVKKTAGLTFAQIESVLVEAMKSMILENREKLSSADVTAQLSYLKRMMSAMDQEQMTFNERELSS